MRHVRFMLGALPLVLTCLMVGGCVRRTISITSDPSGALVWLNDREVGRTPLDVDFLHYGTYDVRLRRDGYEPLLTSGKANPPLWDLPGIDFFAELVPGEPHSKVAWHFTLEPTNNDRQPLLERAEAARTELTGAGGAGADAPGAGGVVTDPAADPKSPPDQGHPEDPPTGNAPTGS